MTEQPEALRLADAIDSDFDPEWMAEKGFDQIAAELRRLHALNAELLEALKTIRTDAEYAGEKTSVSEIDFHLELIREVSRAAIEKAEA